MVTVEDDLIVHNDAFVDSGDVARQLGLLPPAGSAAEARLTKLANARTRAMAAVHGVRPSAIADGVWVVRGGFPIKTMNVYLIEDDGGVTVFDAGISAMGPRCGPAARGSAASTGSSSAMPTAITGARLRPSALPSTATPPIGPRPSRSRPFRDYWHLDRLSAVRPPRLSQLLAAWDGGAVRSPGTVAEGDRVAGFEVVELPGTRRG